MLCLAGSQRNGHGTPTAWRTWWGNYSCSWQAVLHLGFWSYKLYINQPNIKITANQHMYNNYLDGLGRSWHLTIGCCRGKGKRPPKFRIQIKSMLRTPRTTFRTNSVPQLGHGCHDQQNLWSGFWWTLILFCINGTLLLMMVMWMAVSCPVLHSMWVVWMQLPPPTSNWTSHRMHRWSSCEKYNFELALPGVPNKSGDMVHLMVKHCTCIKKEHDF